MLEPPHFEHRVLCPQFYVFRAQSLRVTVVEWCLRARSVDSWWIRSSFCCAIKMNFQRMHVKLNKSSSLAFKEPMIVYLFRIYNLTEYNHTHLQTGRQQGPTGVKIQCDFTVINSEVNRVDENTSSRIHCESSRAHLECGSSAMGFLRHVLPEYLVPQTLLGCFSLALLF